MSDNKSSKIYSQEESLTILDLNQFLEYSLKNKNLILLFLIIGLIAGTLFTFVRRNEFNGTFSILTEDLLKTNESIPQIPNNPLDKIDKNDLKVLSKRESAINNSQFYLINNSSENFKEDFLAILKSDSFLSSVFNETRNQVKHNSNKISFNQWKSNLYINFKKNSSELNIFLKGKNQKFINYSLNNLYKKIINLPNKLNIEIYKKKINNLENSISILKEKNQSKNNLNESNSLEKKLIEDLNIDLEITKINSYRNYYPFYTLSKPSVSSIDKSSYLKINLVLFGFVSLIIGFVTSYISYYIAKKENE